MTYVEHRTAIRQNTKSGSHTLAPVTHNNSQPSRLTMMLSSVLLRRSSRRTSALLVRPKSTWNQRALQQLSISSRTFATNPKHDEEKDAAAAASAAAKEEEEQPKKESLQDSINRMKGAGGNTNNSSSGSKADYNDFLSNAADKWAVWSEEVGKTWQELLSSGERKDINKKLKQPEATAEGEKEYTGPVEIMVIDPSENLSAWERMQKRLTDAPIIQDILSRSEKVYEETGARKAKEKIDVLKEDAQEAWETSQNPWVYRLSSVYDTVTAETPESVAVRELRQLDPDFTLDGWREDVVERTLPQIMQWFLEGKINQLKPWLGEGVFKRLAAEAAARKKEGVQIDTHILGIMNSEILAIEVSERWIAGRLMVEVSVLSMRMLLTF